jgi:hypothetical protein
MKDKNESDKAVKPSIFTKRGMVLNKSSSWFKGGKWLF